MFLSKSWTDFTCYIVCDVYTFPQDARFIYELNVTNGKTLGLFRLGVEISRYLVTGPRQTQPLSLKSRDRVHGYSDGSAMSVEDGFDSKLNHTMRGNDVKGMHGQ